MNRQVVFSLAAVLFASSLFAAGTMPPVTLPVANPDSMTVVKNSANNPTNVLLNDKGVGISVTAVTQGAHGTVAIAPTANAGSVGIVLYTPAQNYVGQDQFSYTITDVNGATASANVSVTVIDPTNPPPPIANPDFAKVNKNSTNNVINVLANDIGNFLSIKSVTQGAHGSVAILLTPGITAGVVTYTPNTDYVGPDQFTYTLTDLSGATAVGNVSVSVVDTTPPPPPCMANPDSATVNENSSANFINVLANDTGTGLTITAVTQGVHGSVAIAAASTNTHAGVTYTPAANYAGQDQFTYTITDANGATSTATVGILVVGTTPPPCVANPDTANVAKNSTDNRIFVLLNDTGVGLTITSVTQGTNGAVSISPNNAGNVLPQCVLYTPAANYVGQDQFTYTITDSGNNTSTATVSVTVIDKTPPPPPVANPDTAIVLKNSTGNPIDVLANDKGVGLSVTAVTQGANGTVTIIYATAGATAIGVGVTYTPATGYVGPDQFTYTITDANGATATAFVSVTVIDNTPPPPPPAMANPDYAKVAKNSTANFIDVLRNDIGTGLTITAITQGANGTVAIAPTPVSNVGGRGGVTYTPNTGYAGQDQFTYTITDSNGATSTANVYIEVIDTTPPPPPGPVANPDFAAVPENSAANFINVLKNDLGTGLTITAVTQGSNGAVAIVAATNTAPAGVSYAPAANFMGQDQFTYTITDGSGATATGTVTVAVIGIKPPPPPPPVIVANPDFARVLKNSQNNPINVLANDFGTGLSVTAVTQGANGSVAIVQNGAGVTYTPNANYVGPDQFTYTITDTAGNTAVGKVSVNVADVPAGPHCNPDFATTTKNSTGVYIPVLANDIGTGLNVTSFTQPANGTVTNNANVLTYVPAANFAGLDTFTYTVTDANGATATGNVSVMVLAPKPTKVFAQCSPPLAAPNQPIAFFAQIASATPVASATFAWDFGDGTTSSQQNPTHAYSATGTYTATVTASSGNTVIGSASVTVQIVGAAAGPVARFTSSSVVAVAGAPITFDASSSIGTIVTYAWDFGDTTTGNTVKVTHTYAAAGPYTVTLTVTDQNSQTASVSHTIQVLAANSTLKSHVQYIAKLNFAVAASDTLNLNAVTNVGTTPVAAGTTVGVTIAGVTYTGTLDANLQDTTQPNVRFAVKQGANPGDVALLLTVKKGTLATAFANAGAVPGTSTAPITISVPVTLSVGAQSVDLSIKTVVLFARNGKTATAAGNGP